MAQPREDREPERRSVESRLQRVEAMSSEHGTRISLVEQKQEHLRMAMDSRTDALEGGQRELLKKIEPLIDLSRQVQGGFTLIKLMGLVGFLGGIVALVKLIRGTP